MAVLEELGELRMRYLLDLDDCGPGGADGEQRRTIRQLSGHRWTARMVQGQDDKGLIDGHLCAWVGGASGPKTHLCLTPEGRFWAAAGRLAQLSNTSVEEMILVRFPGLTRKS